MKTKCVALMLAVLTAALALPDLASAHKCKSPRCYRRHPPAHRYVPYQRPRRVWDDDRSSLYLGLGLVGDFVTETDSDLSRLLNTGGGMDLFLGMRFGPLFALELGFLATVHSTDEQLGLPNQYDRGVMNGVTIDGKFYLLPDSMRVEPFVQVGGGGYSFYREAYEHQEFTGGGFHLGGGVDLRAADSLGFGLRVLYKGVYMDNGTEWYPATDSLYVNQFTVEGNVQLHF